MIKKDSPVLVIRFSSYRNYDFVNEHKAILDKVGSVWMLKLGKKIPMSSLQMFLDAGGNILLKSPKKDGDRYFYAHMVEYIHGFPNDDMSYPEYYKKIIENSWELTLDGTWIKLDDLYEVNDECIDHFYLIKNGNQLKAIVNTTRTATLYVKSDCSFEEGIKRNG